MIKWNACIHPWEQRHLTKMSVFPCLTLEILWNLPMKCNNLFLLGNVEWRNFNIKFVSHNFVAFIRKVYSSFENGIDDEHKRMDTQMRPAHTQISLNKIQLVLSTNLSLEYYTESKRNSATGVRIRTITMSLWCTLIITPTSEYFNCGDINFLKTNTTRSKN